MKTWTFLVVALVSSGSLWSQEAVRKDVLLIDRMRNVEHLSVPQNGQTMARVEQQFGAPERRSPAVGDPPIARWIYPGFTVYFEYDKVIHSVVNRATETETTRSQTG